MTTSTSGKAGNGATALARHALGLDGWRTASYHNRFICGEGSPDFDEWNRMVVVGDAARTGPHKIFAGDYLFRVTLRMARAVLRPGETLDMEDFPEFRALSTPTGDAQP